jgi:hypothetical protein
MRKSSFPLGISNKNNPLKNSVFVQYVDRPAPAPGPSMVLITEDERPIITESGIRLVTEG